MGQAVSDCSIADMGFRGAQREADWAAHYDAVVICPPQTRGRTAWPKPLKTWLAGIRQVIESVNDRLLDTFGLDDERPHELSGVQARLAAKIGVHNVCIGLNRKFGRPAREAKAVSRYLHGGPVNGARMAATDGALQPRSEGFG